MAYMYIVECRDGTYYTGSTRQDPEARVWEHNNDESWSARYTIKRRPVTLVYVEQYDTVDKAFAREKQVQGWSRAKKQALIEERWTDLPGLSTNNGFQGVAASKDAGDASTSSASGLGDASTGSASG